MAAFYGSIYQQPLLLAVPALLWLTLLLFRAQPHDSGWRYGVVFTALSILDAWLTAGTVLGLGPWTGALAVAVPVFFVILGDFRVYFWMHRHERGRFWFKALAWSLVVPAASALVMKLLPEAWTAVPRVTFLVYELLFLGVFSVFCKLKGRFDVFGLYALGYYALWVLADVALLATAETSGFAWCLRITANLLYYVGWMVWVGLSR
jgi:hypothetical protein